jgi:tetratricopeptide (TPR) repeat protein
MRRENLTRAAILTLLLALIFGGGLLLWLARPSMRHLRDGEDHLTRGNFRAAAVAFDLAQANEPDQWRAWSGLAYARLQLGRYDDAAAAARRYTELRPGDPYSWRLLGAALDSGGKMPEAIEAYRRSLALEPDAQAYYWLGTGLYSSGDFNGSVAALQQSLAIDDQSADVWLRLGGALVAAGSGEDGLNAYERARQLGGDALRYRFYTAGALVALERLEEAVAILQACAAEFPTQHTVHCTLGELLRRLERHDEALASLNTAAGLNQGCQATLAAMVWTHAELGDKEEARRWTDRLRPLNVEAAAALDAWLEEHKPAEPLPGVRCEQAGRL